MATLIHTSDLHLGVDRFARTPIAGAYIDVFNEIAEKTIEQGSRYLVIAGDMFHTVNPSFDTLLSVVRTLKKLRDSGIRVVVVPGNHDNSPSGKSALNVISEAGLIDLLGYDEVHNYLISRPLAYPDDSIVFYGLPGFRRSKEVEYLKNGLVRFLDLKHYEKYKVVVVAHVSTKIQGYDPSKFATRYGHLVSDEGELSRRVPPTTSYIALGHVHIPLPFERKFRGKLAYPGAPIGMDANDLRETAHLNERGIKRRVLVVDLSLDTPQVNSIDLDSTPYVKISTIEAKSADEVLKVLPKEVSELPSDYKYKVLLLYASGLERVDIKLDTALRSASSKYNVHIIVQPKPPQVGIEDVLGGGLVAAEVFDIEKTLPEIEDIEEQVLKKVVPRLGLRLSIDKLKWLLNRMSDQVLGDTGCDELLIDLEKEVLEE